MLVEKRLEPLPGGDLDDPAEHVGRHAVVPLAARLEQQWELREQVAGRGEVDARRDGVLEPAQAVHLVDRVRVVEAVGEPGGVGEQVPHAHGLGDRNRRRRQRGAGVVDPGVGERGDEPRHRVGQLQRALLVEHHRGDGGDRLGHRVDAPDRVVGHRQPGLEVAQPMVGQVRDAPAPGDRDRPAREQAVVDVAAEVPVDPREPGGVEPDLPGLGVDLDQGHGPTLLARGRGLVVREEAEDGAAGSAGRLTRAVPGRGSRRRSRVSSRGRPRPRRPGGAARPPVRAGPTRRRRSPR